MFYYKKLIYIFSVILISSLLSTIYASVSTSLPDRKITLTTINDTAYFSGSALSNNPGKPNLPKYSITFLLPPNTDLNSINVEIVNKQYTELTDSIFVVPAEPPTIRGELFWPKELNIIDGKDIDVYNANKFYPDNFLGSYKTGLMDEYVLIEVEVYPYKFNPVTGKLQNLTEGKLTVNFNTYASASSVTSHKINHSIKSAVSNLVVNYNEQASKYREPVSINSTNSVYYIITTNNIVDNSTKFKDFVDSKIAKGFDVTVVTEDLWGGGVGDVAADNIRNYLKANYKSKSIEYVLLIGDPNPSFGKVPMKKCYPRNNASYNTQYKDSPTDFYFADLSGNWDLDGDKKYGEYRDDFKSGGADKYAEVMVGRIPFYNNFTDLDNILSKIIKYENTSKSEATWRKNVILPMEPSDAYTPGWHLAEAIKSNFLVPSGFSSHRIYDEDYGQNPETVPCTINNVKNVWKNGEFGYALWWTHGNSTYAADVMSSTTSLELNDNKPSFTFQVSCLNAYPENSNNLAYSMLKNGGISTISATRVSWYWRGQTNFENTGTNSGMGYEYTKRLVAEGKPAGEALNLVKSTLSPNADYMWMNWLDFNLYGDPSIGLFTDSPDEYIKIKTPTTVDKFSELDTINISWTSLGVTYFKVELSLDSGKTFQVINHIVNDSSTIYITPKIVAPYSKIRVSDINSSLYGESNFFVISDSIKPLITVSIFDSLDEDNSLDIDIMGTYINDGYSDFEIIDDATHGVITKNGGLVNFTPDMDFFGKDSFSYRYQDNKGKWSGKAWCVIEVDPVNDAPKLNFKAPDVFMNSGGIDTSINVSNMFYDPDSNSMFYQVQNSVLLFSDDFSIGTLNSSKWTGNAVSNIKGLNEPSPSYSTEFLGGQNATTIPIDLKGYISCKVVFDWEREGTSLAPTENDDLVLEYLNSSGIWKIFARFNHNQGAITKYTNVEYTLDADALHKNFAVRISNSGAGGSYFVDNFRVYGGAYSNFATILDDGSLMLNPPANWFGDKEIVITAIDETGLESYDTLSLNVNKKPISTSAKYSLKEDETKFFVLDGEDEDGEIIDYEIIDLPKHGDLLGVNPNKTYIPISDFFGQDSFSYRVKDDLGIYSKTSWIYFNIDAVNDPPYFTSNDTLIAVEGKECSYEIKYVDKDDIPTLTVEYLPTWLTQNGNIISGTPASSDINGSFDLKVNDGKDTTDMSVFVSVQHKPTITSTPVLSSKEGKLYKYNVVVSDKEDNTFSYVLKSYPPRMSISSTGDITWTPTNSDANIGSYEITIEVNDKGTPTLSDEQTYTLTVENTNNAPKFTSVVDTIYVNKGDTLSKLINTSDIDDTDLIYSVVSGNDISLYPQSDGVKIGWRANAYTDETVKLKVSDNGGLFDEMTFVICVNDAPIANDILASLNEDENITLTFDATDNDGTIEGYEITHPKNGSAVITSSSVKYIPYANFNGYDTLYYRAKDNKGIWSEYAKAVFTVVEVDDSPKFNSSTEINVAENSSFSYIIDVTDIDNTPSISILNKPNWVTVNGLEVSGTPTGEDIDTSFTVQINSGSYSGTQKVTINVQHSPIFNNSPNTTATQDVLYTYNASASDSDGDNIIYSLETKLSSMNISQSGVISWTPNNYDALSGSADVKVIATDNGDPSLSKSQTFTINVTNVNDTPTFDKITGYSETVDSGKVFTKKFYANDIDGDTLIFTATQKPNGTTITTGTDYIEATWTATTPSPAIFKFKVSDGKDYSEMTYNVDINLAPVAKPQKLIVEEDNRINFILEGIDGDGTIKDYKIFDYPTKGTLYRSGKYVNYYPSQNESGEDSLTYIVMDNNNSWSKEATVKISITEVNDDPKIISPSVIYVDDVKGLNRMIYIVDPDDTPTVTIENKPDWITYLNNTISGVPTATDFSTTITVVADDGHNRVTKDIMIYVQHTPAIITKADTTATEDELYSYNIDATDVDNDQLYYYLLIAPIGMKIDSRTGEISWTPNNSDALADDRKIKVKVFDCGYPSLSTYQTYKINVENVNDAPKFNSLGSYTKIINEGSLFSKTFYATDIDDEKLTFSIIDAPTGLVINSNDKYVTVTYPANSYGVKTFKLKVEDEEGLSDELTFDIKVNAVPTATDQLIKIDEDTKVDITFSGSDVDGTVDGFVVTKNSKNGALRFISNNKIEYIPKLDFYGADSFYYASKDNYGAISTPAKVSIIVEAVNDTPIIVSSGSINIIEGQALYYKAIVEDNDDTPTVTFENLPDWITVNGSILRGTPLHTSEDCAFNIVATDKYLTVKKSVTINIDHKPVIISKAVVNATQDVEYNYALNLDEKDGDRITYKLITAPDGMKISSAGVITWTPTNSDALTAKFDITVSAEDKTTNLLKDTQVFLLTVLNVNDAPEFISLPNNSKTIKEGENFTITLLSKDIDEDAMTLSVIGLPTGAISSTTANSITVDYDSSMAGSYNLKFKVEDENGLLDTFDFTLIVEKVSAAKDMTPFKNDGYSVIIGPTPFVNTPTIFFTIDEFINNKTVNMSLEIYNVNGKLISKISKEAYTGENSIYDWYKLSTLIPGRYYVVLRVNGKVEVIEPTYKSKR